MLGATGPCVHEDRRFVQSDEKGKLAGLASAALHCQVKFTASLIHGETSINRIEVSPSNRKTATRRSGAVNPGLPGCGGAEKDQETKGV